MLGRLQAEPVAPILADAEGTYADFWIALDGAQTLISGEIHGGAGLSPEPRAEAIDALQHVQSSAHVVSLPPLTIDAVNQSPLSNWRSPASLAL
ncbi:MAG: hypothetical protein WA880_03610 [Ornithinimicrobium sp.]